jgi:hypothetical protein
MQNPAEGRQIPIDTATLAQLKVFATHLGCTVTRFDNAAKVRKAIADSGYEEAHIIISDGAPSISASKKAAAGETAKPGAMDEPMCSIEVHIAQGSGGKRPLFVGVNGKALLIPRGKICEVKLRYLDAIKIAVETKYEYDEEAKANMPLDTPSYSYQIHRQPSEDEQAKWHAHVAAEEAAANTRDAAARRAA